ncbi:hypothetical protein niasHT_001968 [Heterodera trifolii]|uniref:Ubiquitin-like domain-containing protein n=1 Tax=Heterodera trifolii TaxID=157864 RepID=A0ABD2M3C7_9BILA
MKQFVGLSLFPVGISAWLLIMPMLLLLLMASSTDGIKIVVNVDENIANEINQQQISVRVDGTTTVEELKKQIQTKTKIPPKKQTLELKKSNGTLTVLKDKKTLKHYGIVKDGTAIFLSVKFEIILEADTMITKWSKMIAFEVYGTETVEELKKMIKAESGIEPEEQTLRKNNNTNGPVMDDKNKTLKNYGIGKGAFLFLSVKFEIKVTKVGKAGDEHDLFKKLISIEVIGTDKVEDLKKKIIGTMKEKDKTKIGTDLKRLTLTAVQQHHDKHNYDNDVLKDGETINCFAIRACRYVRWSISEFEIVVRNEKRDIVQHEENEMHIVRHEKKVVTNYSIWVTSAETVGILKKKIENESGIKRAEQILKCGITNGPAEMEDKKKLEFYGIGISGQEMEDRKKLKQKLRHYGSNALGIGHGTTKPTPTTTTTIFLTSEYEVIVDNLSDKKNGKKYIMVKRTDILATLKHKIREAYTKANPNVPFSIVQLVKKFKNAKKCGQEMRVEDVEQWYNDADSEKTMDKCGIGEGSTVFMF